MTHSIYVEAGCYVVPSSRQDPIGAPCGPASIQVSRAMDSTASTDFDATPTHWTTRVGDDGRVDDHALGGLARSSPWPSTSSSRSFQWVRDALQRQRLPWEDDVPCRTGRSDAARVPTAVCVTLPVMMRKDGSTADSPLRVDERSSGVPHVPVHVVVTKDFTLS